uniref:Ninjurin 1 n=1 Tax=Sinocyclocheilus grahami TaxID=75366 RepID=A0A672Q2U6_SINGR
MINNSSCGENIDSSQNSNDVSHSLGLSRAPLNMNHYANKSVAESMLDVALLMANASQLKAVLEQGPKFTLYTSLITLISLSLCLQVLVGILLIFIVKWNLNDEQTHLRLNVLENITTCCIFIIVVITVFITAFGVQVNTRGMVLSAVQSREPRSSTL